MNVDDTRSVRTAEHDMVVREFSELGALIADDAASRQSIPTSVRPWLLVSAPRPCGVLETPDVGPPIPTAQGKPPVTAAPEPGWRSS